jgi:hypothetical protein
MRTRTELLAAVEAHRLRRTPKIPGGAYALRMKLERAAPKKVKRAIARLYAQARQLTQEHWPTEYEVDHVIPISKGGAHHPDNMRVVTAAENRRKGCRLLTS